ncbi:hypothetical protein GCM10023264_11960 [Sphingomonas daechungensis]
MKRNHRAPWTAEAVDELERLASQCLTAREIADQTGRTEEAIRLKARFRGIKLAKAEPRSEVSAGMRNDVRSYDDEIDEMVKRSIEQHGP